MHTHNTRTTHAQHTHTHTHTHTHSFLKTQWTYYNRSKPLLVCWTSAQNLHFSPMYCRPSSKYIAPSIMAPHTATPLSLLRETSRLANPQLPSNGESYSSPSLPTHLTLPPPLKPPIYGHPTMQPDDFHKMVEPRVNSFFSTDFLLGYMRLCLAATNIHKGVTNKVGCPALCGCLCRLKFATCHLCDCR